MPAGRPPKYNTPEEMQDVIDLYFLAVKCHKEMERGNENAHEMLSHLDTDELHIVNEVTDSRPTVTGLALALDMTRQAICDYECKPEFLDTIKKAKLKIENALENNLYSGQVAGTIFNLKNNFDWKDKTETQHSGDKENPLVVLGTEMPAEQATELYKRLLNG